MCGSQMKIASQKMIKRNEVKDKSCDDKNKNLDKLDS